MLEMRIRITSRNQEEVEVSWQESLSQESYHILSPVFLRDFLKGWRRFCSYWFHSLDFSHTSSSQAFPEEIHNKGTMLASLLFGRKWKESLCYSLGKVDSIVFVTDPEWTQIPYEILPLEEKGFSPICFKIPVLRSIRSQEIPRKGKSGKDALLWFHFNVGNSQESRELQESLENEKSQLEEVFQEASLPFESIATRESLRPYLWERLHTVKYLHFAGHTERNLIPLDKNRNLEYKEIGKLDLSNLELVFWNSCYSGYQDQSSEGLVKEILQAGVKEFIGFNSILPSSLASVIGVEFWKLYWKTKNTKKAILELRRSLLNQGKGIAAFFIVHYNQGFPSHDKEHLKKIPSLALASVGILIGLLSFSFFRSEEKTHHQETTILNQTMSVDGLPQKKNIPKNEKPKQDSSKLEKANQNLHSNPSLNSFQIVGKSRSHPNKKKELEVLMDSIQSESLKKAAMDFLNEENQMYDQKEREKILIDILSKSHESNELKIWKIEKKRNAW